MRPVEAASVAAGENGAIAARGFVIRRMVVATPLRLCGWRRGPERIGFTNAKDGDSLRDGAAVHGKT